MNKKQRIQEIEKIAKKYFKKTNPCHDWTHIERVKKLALHIGQKEGADLEILEIASLLHDIGRLEEEKNKGQKKCGTKLCHAEIGAKEARTILKKYNFSTKKYNNIIHCIQAHRFRGKNKPKTLEAKILFDADKLDSIGAIGVARGFLFAGGPGSQTLYTGNEKKLAKNNKDYSYTKEDSAILEYEIKLKYVKNRILTSTGKQIAKARHHFMEKFFQRFWQEVEGKK